MPAAGYGRKSQDWSYLTPVRALYLQSEVITDPALIPVEGIIDMTKDSRGRVVERARNQTLVIHIINKLGGLKDSLNTTPVIYLWAEAVWAEQTDALACELASSSSSNTVCRDIGLLSEISETNRWALMEAAKHANHAVGALSLSDHFPRSLAYVFPWLPAGRYKAAVAICATIGDAIIAEQHSE